MSVQHYMIRNEIEKQTLAVMLEHLIYLTFELLDLPY